jgi:hypothetical protein
VPQSNPKAATKPEAVGAPATNGDKGPLPDDSFDNTDSKLARCNADEKRKAQWKNRLYALSILDGRREPWARHVVSAAAYSNAKRDPVSKGPALTFTGDAAMDAGATDDEMHALPRLSPDEIASLRIEAAAMRELTRHQIRRRAAALATARPALSDAIRLAKDMVSDPPAGVIVDKLLYEKTVTSWVGDGGTFKSFTVLALACSVAAGRDFSGQLRVPQRYPVLYMCAEHRRHGLIGDIRAWCQANHADVDELAVYGWDDVAQLGDDSQMDELADFVATHGIKLVVFDTQRKATKGLEENSSTDMGAALANAQRLAYETSAAVVIIHHTTRGAEHARGSSVMRDDTDATIIQRAVVGEMAAEIVIDKHKSEPARTTYPIRLESVTVTGTPILDVDAGVAMPGEAFTTLVARPRDPVTTDERVERTRASLDPDSAILVAVVEENGGAPLSPTETHRLAARRGYEASVDTAFRHLQRLASIGCIAEHTNASNGRRTYSSTQPQS